MLWYLIPFVILWSVWQERNSRIFRRISATKEDVAQLILLCIAKWASSKDVFNSISVCGILHIWKGSLLDDCTKVPKIEVWVLPTFRELKFNVYGATSAKLWPAGIGGVLHNSFGHVIVMFSKNVNIMELNQVVEVLAILEAFKFLSFSFRGKLVVQ